MKPTELAQHLTEKYFAAGKALDISKMKEDEEVKAQLRAFTKDELKEFYNAWAQSLLSLKQDNHV